jgi:hypothetical protein
MYNCNIERSLLIVCICFQRGGGDECILWLSFAQQKITYLVYLHLHTYLRLHFFLTKILVLHIYLGLQMGKIVKLIKKFVTNILSLSSIISHYFSNLNFFSYFKVLCSIIFRICTLTGFPPFRSTKQECPKTWLHFKSFQLGIKMPWLHFKSFELKSQISHLLDRLPVE